MKAAPPPVHRTFLVLLVLAVAAVGCTAAEDEPQPPVPGVAESLEAEFASVVQDVLPSVVEISHGRGVGSGVVFDDQGHTILPRAGKLTLARQLISEISKRINKHSLFQ